MVLRLRRSSGCRIRGRWVRCLLWGVWGRGLVGFVDELADGLGCSVREVRESFDGASGMVFRHFTVGPWKICDGFVGATFERRCDCGCGGVGAGKPGEELAWLDECAKQ